MKEILQEIVSRIQDYTCSNNSYTIFEYYIPDIVWGSCFCLDLVLNNPALGKISEYKMYFNPQSFNEEEARKEFLARIIPDYIYKKNTK